MSVIIRRPEYTDAEYEGIIALYRAVFPNYADTADVWKADDDNRDPKFFYQRLIVLKEGEIVGTGSYEEPAWAYEEGKYFIRIVVHPNFRGQGIGSKIFDHIVEGLEPRHPKKYSASTHEDQPEAVRFLERHGFQQIIYEPISQLDVEGFDISRYREIIASAEASGVQIHSATTLLKNDPQFWQKIYDLDSVVTQDLPLPTPYTMPTFEMFVKEMRDERRGFVSDYWMIAVGPSEDDRGHGKYVGRSTLWQNAANPAHVTNGMTGIIRDYRRRGLATALKAKVIESARQNGVKLAKTQNADVNPMLQLNLALGFEIVNAYLGFEKRLVP